jgi:hypothetical protein
VEGRQLAEDAVDLVGDDGGVDADLGGFVRHQQRIDGDVGLDRPGRLGRHGGLGCSAQDGLRSDDDDVAQAGVGRHGPDHMA